MSHEEAVLVVPRRTLFGPGSPEFQGLLAQDGEPYLAQVDAAGTFVGRRHAEEDPRLKQIIPYGVVLHEQSVFVMRRSARGGETRLHDKVSIGVGGHVNPEDAPRTGPPGTGVCRECVVRSLYREIAEELIVDTPWSCEVAGVLNDDSNSVGQVHFGVVFVVRPRTRALRVREAELSEGAFVPLADLPDLVPDMETWSALVARALAATDLAWTR